MIRTEKLTIKTQGECDVHDLTAEVRRAVKSSGLKSGSATIFVPGSTAGVTTIEFEPGCCADLAEAFERIAPRGAGYEHHRRWGDGNGHSHVRAALLGPSLVVPFAEGELLLGTWQQIVLVDLDNRGRRREVVVQVSGE